MQIDHEQAFKDAEASLLLEGFTPSEEYYKVKARILAGEITTQEGKSALIAHYIAEAKRAKAEEREWIDAPPVGRELL